MPWDLVMNLFEISRTREQRELLRQQEPIAKQHVLGTNIRFTREGLVTADGYTGVHHFNDAIFPLSFAPVLGSFYVSRCPSLTKIVGLPPSIDGSFTIEYSPKFPILSLFRVKNIVALFLVGKNDDVEKNDMIEAIWHRHYKPSGDGDILMCQDDLIEAGFSDIARM